MSRRMTNEELWAAVETIIKQKDGIPKLKANTKRELEIAMSAIPVQKSMGLSDDEIFAVLIAAARDVPFSAVISICSLAMLELYNRDHPCKTR